LESSATSAAYEGAVAASESAAASAAVGGTGTAAAGRTAAAAGSGLVREQLFLLSSYSSRLLLFLSLPFVFAGLICPCLQEDAAVGDFLQEKEILSLLVSNTILAPCCVPNNPDRSRGGGQLLSLERQLRTAMYCC
jgi:hypothetical protein